MKNKNPKILIVVKGGVVQSIYSSDKKLRLEILDFDNEESKNDEKEEQKLKSLIKGISAIY